MKRKQLLIAGLILVQLLLMGSAFVGGRMLGEQNRRTNRPAGSLQLPAQLPRDPAAGTGAVQRIQENLITLGRGFGGAGRSNSNTETEVAITADTKFYKNVSAGQPGQPGQPGAQTQVQVADATLADVKVGNNVIVWGTKSGERITAQVVYIQGAGR